MSHTRRPWEMMKEGDGVAIFHLEEYGAFPIADVHIEPEPALSETMANARLIAAAPDLLEVAETVLECDLMDCTKCRESLRAAIAKAKGE